MFFVPTSMTGNGNDLMDASSFSIQNKERLPATDVSESPHHRTPVSLLVYTEFADLSPGNYGEFKNTMDSIRSTYNLPFDYENLTDYMELQTKLWNYDILLIPEQELITAGQVSDVADAWGVILHEWVDAGGIVVMMDFYGFIAGPTMGIYNQTGLMNAEPYDAGPSYTIYNVNTLSPLTQGVAASWSSSNGTVLFTTTDANVVVNVFVDDATYAFVAHKIIGRGHVVLLGFDFFVTEPNAEIILANAIRLHRHVVFDQSHLPYYTIQTGFDAFVSDLTSFGYACSAMENFDTDYLQACDVLVLSASLTTYSSAVVDEIEAFVTGGGGLFVASDWGQYGAELDPIIERFDFIRNKTHALADSDDLVGNEFQFRCSGENVIFHSATMQVSSIEIYAATGFVQIPDDAVPLIITDSDGTTTFENDMIANATPVSAALTVGDGRIIVFGDTNAMDNSSDIDGDMLNNYYDSNNPQFLTNCIRWLAAAGLEEVSVVFDESHNPNFTLGSSFRGFSLLLTENGFTVYRMTEFDPDFIVDKDILFIVDGTVSYFENELQWIQDFVSAGNGLLLLGAYGVYGEQTATIANEYGIDLDTSGPWLGNVSSYTSVFNQNHFGDHPIMNGINRLEFTYATGLNATGDSTPLVTTPGDGTYFWSNGTTANDTSIITAQQFEMGRIVVSGDYVSIRYNLDSDGDGTINLYDSDNELFWINVLSWLGENRAPEVQVVSPNGGETLTGDHLITWSAVDGNGDSMTFDVHYSINGGGSWSALSTGLTSPSILWDTTAYDDGADYLIRVTVTDGELTNQDTSDAVFTVDNKGPTTSPGDTTTLLLIIIGAGAAVIIIIIVVFLKKKKWSDRAK